MKRFVSITLSILMVASLTLGGALVALQFPQAVENIPVVVKPMDIWPTEAGQT